MITPVPKPIKAKKVKKEKKMLTKTQERLAEKKLVKKLTKELKHVCSMITRKRWGGKCAMCGKEGTASHHFFGWKACSSLRFTLDNLVWLCYGCHIGKVHQQGLTEPARKKLINKIGQDKFDSMYGLAFMRKEWTSESLVAEMMNVAMEEKDVQTV